MEGYSKQVEIINIALPFANVQWVEYGRTVALFGGSGFEWIVRVGLGLGRYTCVTYSCREN